MPMAMPMPIIQPKKEIVAEEEPADTRQSLSKQYEQDNSRTTSEAVRTTSMGVKEMA